MEEVSRAASRCHDGAAPVGAGCSPAPAPPPGGVCLPLPSLLRRGRRHCPSPPRPGRPPPPHTHTRPLGLPPGGALGLWRRRQQQRPARRRLHFPFFVSALEAGSWPDWLPGRGPPSALRPSRGGWPQRRGDLRIPAPAPALLEGPDPLSPRARAARCPGSMSVGPWPTPLCLPLLQHARSPEPTPAALRAYPCRSAALRSLPVRAPPPLVSVSAEWRRRRCCGCEQRDPRAAESSLCKAG